MRKLKFDEALNAMRYVVFSEFAKLFMQESQTTMTEFCAQCIEACEKKLLVTQFDPATVGQFAAEVWHRYPVY